MTERAYDAVDIERAAKFLGLSERQIQRLVAAGKLPVIRYTDARAVRFDLGVLKKYRDDHTTGDD